jgi:hypothetical protein
MNEPGEHLPFSWYHATIVRVPWPLSMEAECKEDSMPVSPRYRDLVSLFPRFLTVRRRQWTGLLDILHSSKLDRPAFFLLMALVQETDPGQALSRKEMESQLFNPYSTFNPIFDSLPLLLEREYLLDLGTDYLVRPQGRALIEHTEQAARDYIATLTPLPLPELTRLATFLEEIAGRMWQADEPAVKAHQARCHRLPPITTAAPMVHLEAAIFALWMARDDAHIAAWRTRGLSGPYLDLLTRLWTGEAHTISALTTCLQHTQRPEDIAQGVTALGEAGYVLVEGERITLTESGRQIRTQIEEDTDRMYFTSWPELSPEALDEMYTSLETVCDTLSR